MMESVRECLKNSVRTFLEKKEKKGCLEGSGVDAQFLKVKTGGFHTVCGGSEV
jgi:hypothetical protein